MRLTAGCAVRARLLLACHIGALLGVVGAEPGRGGKAQGSAGIRQRPESLRGEGQQQGITGRHTIHDSRVGSVSP